MQTSGISANSAAWALRQLFQPQQNAGQQASSAGQFLPTAAAAGSPAAGVNGAQLSPDVISAFTSLQTQAPGASSTPSTSDVAAQLISSLDSNGDGEVSLAEAEAAGGNNAAQAFAALDTNGDGNLSSDEIGKALQNAQGAQGAHRHGGHHHHHAPSASDAASSLMQALDTDGQDGLSLSEVTSAVGGDASSTAIQNGFSALDTDGNGVLSLSELTSAIQQYQQGSLTQAAQNASAGLTI